MTFPVRFTLKKLAQLTKLIMIVIFNTMNRKGIRYSQDTYFAMESSEDAESRRHGQYSITMNRELAGHDMRLEHLRDGLSLFMNDTTLDQDTTFAYQMGEGAVMISTILSGTSCNRPDSRGASKAITINGPCDMVTYSAHCAGEIFIKGGEPRRFVTLDISRDMLLEMTEGDERFASLKKTLQHGDGIHQLGLFTSSPRTRHIASEIFECSLVGACRHIFMEGKALELISAALERLDDSSRSGRVSMSRSDVERINEARRILLQDILNPPSIHKLARDVGTNEFKLKQGFREVFGCSPYQALRAHRMETAKSMLADNDLTVTHVASMVGYTNIGHFIKAFRQHFGVTPGSILRHSRHHSKI